MIRQNQADIPGYFEIGRDLETYESMNELAEKIRCYLSHEEKRIEIAMNGYEKAAKHHTYEIRLTQMIKILTDTI